MRLSKAPAVEYFSMIIEKNRVHDFPSLSKVNEVKIRIERSEIERLRTFLDVVEQEELTPIPFERDPMDERKANLEFGT